MIWPALHMRCVARRGALAAPAAAALLMLAASAGGVPLRAEQPASGERLAIVLAAMPSSEVRVPRPKPGGGQLPGEFGGFGRRLPPTKRPRPRPPRTIRQRIRRRHLQGPWSRPANAAPSEIPAEIEAETPSAEPGEAEKAVAGEGVTAPLPRPRPAPDAATAARAFAEEILWLRAGSRSEGGDRCGRRRPLRGRPRDRGGSPECARPSLIEWLIARQPDANLSAAEILAVLESHRGWPEPERLQLRAEQAFHALGPDRDSVLAFYSQAQPRTVGGRMALAGALRDAGRREEAHDIARDAVARVVACAQTRRRRS